MNWHASGTCDPERTQRSHDPREPPAVVITRSQGSTFPFRSTPAPKRSFSGDHDLPKREKLCAIRGNYECGRGNLVVRKPSCLEGWRSLPFSQYPHTTRIPSFFQMVKVCDSSQPTSPRHCRHRSPLLHPTPLTSPADPYPDVRCERESNSTDLVQHLASTPNRYRISTASLSSVADQAEFRCWFFAIGPRKPVSRGRLAGG